MSLEKPKVGDIIRLVDKPTFIAMHSQNKEIAATFKNFNGTVESIGEDNSVRRVNINGKSYGFGLYQTELHLCFESVDHDSVDDDMSGYGSFKIIITYEDGRTIEEEGVTNINIKPKSVSYAYNRKKYGFLKYQGEVSLELKELKQITVSTPSSERVFHIENALVIREHIMYDNERAFKAYRVGN